jgi:hypothetical protein
MRNAHDPDTARALIDSGLLLGIACLLCRSRVIFPMEKIARDPRPVWRPQGPNSDGYVDTS